MNRLRRLRWSGLLLASAAFLPMMMNASTASAADVELRLAHWVPPQHPVQTTGFEPWAESIKQASEGRIEITIFPAQQLGAAPDHYDMARDGIADISYINAGYQPGRFPVIGLGELPFLVDNARAGARAFDEWYRAYAGEEMADVHYCLTHMHSPGTFHSKEKLTHPDDVAGKTVRPAGATMARFITMLGGASVQVPAPEAREVLAKGAADAITFPWNSIYLFGIDGVTHHHLDMPFYTTTLSLVMNKARYDGMSDADKKVIDDHCTSEWAEKTSTGWADWEDEGRTLMVNDPEHHTLYQPSAEEVAAWRTAAEPLLEAWKEDVNAAGVDADAAYQALVDNLEKHDSLVK